MGTTDAANDSLPANCRTVVMVGSTSIMDLMRCRTSTRYLSGIAVDTRSSGRASMEAPIHVVSDSKEPFPHAMRSPNASHHIINFAADFAITVTMPRNVAHGSSTNTSTRQRSASNMLCADRPAKAAPRPHTNGKAAPPNNTVYHLRPLLY